MKDIIKIYQVVQKYKKENETIVEFYDRYNITFFMWNDHIELTYNNIKYIIKTEQDMKRFLSRLLIKHKLKRIINEN